MIYEKCSDHRVPSECSTLHALYFLIFLLPNMEVFYPKTICNPREIFPQNVSSLGLTVLEGSFREQTNTQTHWHPIALEEGLPIDWTYLIYAILQCMEYIKEKDEKYFSSFSFIFFCIARWYVQSIDNPSSKATGCQWVCVFVCFLTPSQWFILMSSNFEGWFPLGCRRF